MLTTLYERFEQVNSDFADAHKKFHNEFEKMEEAMEKRSRWLREWRKLL